MANPKAGPGTLKDLYWSATWQLLEERTGGVARAQYLWSPIYIDALVARYRDSDNNGTLDGAAEDVGRHDARARGEGEGEQREQPLKVGDEPAVESHGPLSWAAWRVGEAGPSARHA